jgi:hypothetical protein
MMWYSLVHRNPIFCPPCPIARTKARFPAVDICRTTHSPRPPRHNRRATFWLLREQIHCVRRELGETCSEFLGLFIYVSTYKISRIICQKTLIFIFTARETSNLTSYLSVSTSWWLIYELHPGYIVPCFDSLKIKEWLNELHSEYGETPPCIRQSKLFAEGPSDKLSR